MPSLIRYLLDRYKTQEMCDNVIKENGGMLMVVSYCNRKNIVTKMLIIMRMHYKFSLISVRFKKCRIFLSILIFPQ